MNSRTWLLGLLLNWTSGAQAWTPKEIQSELEDNMRWRVKQLGLPTPAYFWVPLAYEDDGNPAAGSHTFAGFVRVDAQSHVKWRMISWLPKKVATEGICVFADFWGALGNTFLGNPCSPVEGKNWDIRQSLKMAKASGRSLAYWGPYHITAELFELGEARWRHLNAGGATYLADDRYSRRDSAVNCMHAVADLQGHRQRWGLLGRVVGWGRWGILGTQRVIDHYGKRMDAWFITPPDSQAYHLFYTE